MFYNISPELFSCCNSKHITWRYYISFNVLQAFIFSVKLFEPEEFRCACLCLTLIVYCSIIFDLVDFIVKLLGKESFVSVKSDFVVWATTKTVTETTTIETPKSESFSNHEYIADVHFNHRNRKTFLYVRWCVYAHFEVSNCRK